MKVRFMVKILVTALAIIIGSVACVTVRQDETPTVTITSDVKDKLVATQYKVQIRYSTSATQDDFNEVIALLRTYDQNLRYLRQEIFPVIDIVFLRTDSHNFCLTVKGVLKAKIYIQKVTCQEWVDPPLLEDPEQKKRGGE